MSGLSDEKLDELLRGNFVTDVDDDGFSARVLRALPSHPRPWLLPAAALAGSLFAWLALLPAPLLQQATREWLAGDIGTASAFMCALLLGVALLGCGWALEEST